MTEPLASQGLAGGFLMRDTVVGQATGHLGRDHLADFSRRTDVPSVSPAVRWAIASLPVHSSQDGGVPGFCHFSTSMNCPSLRPTWTGVRRAFSLSMRKQTIAS